MKITMDSAGRVVIPREIRRAASLEAGQPLDIAYRDGAVVIEPATMQVRLERRGRFVVAVPLGKVENLTIEQVNETLERVRFREDE